MLNNDVQIHKVYYPWPKLSFLNRYELFTLEWIEYSNKHEINRMFMLRYYSKHFKTHLRNWWKVEFKKVEKKLLENNNNVYRKNLMDSFKLKTVYVDFTFIISSSFAWIISNRVLCCELIFSSHWSIFSCRKFSQTSHTYNRHISSKF